MLVEVEAASVQTPYLNRSGSLAPFNIALVLEYKVANFLSTFPFCSGEALELYLNIMPIP